MLSDENRETIWVGVGQYTDTKIVSDVRLNRSHSLKASRRQLKIEVILVGSPALESQMHKQSLRVGKQAKRERDGKEKERRLFGKVRVSVSESESESGWVGERERWWNKRERRGAKAQEHQHGSRTYCTLRCKRTKPHPTSHIERRTLKSVQSTWVLLP